MQSALKTVHTTNKVYSQLQGLISTFQSIIVPEALNHVVSEDAEMLQLLRAIKSIRVTSQPAVPVRNVMDTLNEEYHQAAVNVSYYGNVLCSSTIFYRELKCLSALKRFLTRLSRDLMNC